MEAFFVVLLAVAMLAVCVVALLAVRRLGGLTEGTEVEEDA